MIRPGSSYNERDKEDRGMGATQKYVILDPASGKLDRRIFSDQAIYDEEMAKIFGRAWLMIGHESLVPKVNDFFHTYMGEDPVILTRDSQGRLHALLNMCRHRGNRVVRCDDGNTRHFMCTYHGWTYANDGTLAYVPGESEAYYNALDRPSFRSNGSSQSTGRRWWTTAPTTIMFLPATCPVSWSRAATSVVRGCRMRNSSRAPTSTSS